MVLIYNRSIKRRNNFNSIEAKKAIENNKDLVASINSLIRNARQFPINSNNTGKIDLVYIVRPGEINNDLRYSLRSVSKFCNYRYIWIVGFKPHWVQNVKYIHTEQNQDKWKNSIINYKAACECPEISKNFVLMNDDFFAIRQITDWNHDCNVCLGNLEKFVNNFANIEHKSKWQWGFTYVVNLLNEMQITRHYNYEAHTPIIINKNNFLQMLNMSVINKFQESKKVLHKRSLYKNLFPDEGLPPPRVISDVKLDIYKDITEKYLQENWISTYDDTLNNKSFPLVNMLLQQSFDKPCKYEKVL